MPDRNTTEIPYGFCHCGCGQKTKLASRSCSKDKMVKGEPLRYIFGHYNRVCVEPPNPSGLCQCGCGQKTSMAKQTCQKYGWVKGQPMRFLLYHHAPSPIPLAERFWSRVNIGNCDECWEWQSRRIKGYGAFTYRHGKYEYAHRFAYKIVNGTIPRGMGVLHKCDNPPCCNPSHLFLGTQSDNLHDMAQKGRNAKGERSGTAKLTKSDVIEIRSTYPSKTMQVLADRYGVTLSTISKIVHRERWAHIP